MAELSWDDVISNPQAFPDEMVLRDLGPDVGQRLINARKGVVPVAVAQRYVQRAEALADEKRALETQLATRIAGDGQPPGQTMNPYPIDYNTDPLLGPMHRDSQRALELATANAKAQEDLGKTLGQILHVLTQLPTVNRIEQIRQTDPTVNPDRLVEAHQQRMKHPDIADTYRLMTYDQKLMEARAAAKEEGIKEAEDKARMNPTVPFMPYGPAQSVALPQPAFTTIEQAEQAALQDAEIIGSYYSG